MVEAAGQRVPEQQPKSCGRGPERNEERKVRENSAREPERTVGEVKDCGEEHCERAERSVGEL